MMDVSGIQSKMACITLFDATILFDSFTHIYLVFCPCFIYKMPWYLFVLCFEGNFGCKI
jgi:hypothetical protein